jgi:hypothetical protein
MGVPVWNERNRFLHGEFRGIDDPTTLADAPRLSEFLSRRFDRVDDSLHSVEIAAQRATALGGDSIGAPGAPSHEGFLAGDVADVFQLSQMDARLPQLPRRGGPAILVQAGFDVRDFHEPRGRGPLL